MLALRVLILAVSAIVAYSNSLSNPMVIDDQVTILENRQIRDLWSPEVLMPERELTVAGRPLANVTFAVNYALGGTSVGGYRAVNLLLHVLCGIAAFALIRRVLPEEVAFGTALLWLLHPLNSEVMNYLTQRTEALMALFYLLTMYASVRALESKQWQAIAIGACILGVASKESMATAPVMVMLFDRIFVFDSWKAAWKRRRSLYAGLFASWVLLAALLATGPRIRSTGFNAGVSVWTYLLNQAVMITQYLRLTFWPRSLVVYYGYPEPLTLGAVLPYALLVVALLAITVVAFRYRPKLAFLGAWFFVTLAPSSSIVPIATEVGAERRMYLPLLAVLLLLMLGVRQLTRTVPIRQAIVVILALLLGAQTFARNREYADPLQLAEVTLARWPSGVAHHLVAEKLIAAGRNEEGIAHLRQATATAPRAHYTLGLMLYNQGQIDEAITELREFIRLQPLLLEVPDAHVSLARAYARQGRWDEALVQAQEAIAKAPANADARGMRAEILFRQEQAEAATAAYLDYLRMRPNDSGALTNLAILYISAGRVPQALDTFRRAADVDPADGEKRRNLAMALLDSNRIDEAVIEGRRAIALRPDDPVARDLLAQALAKQGQLRR
jgi:protein O-mannosyl-transferase